MAKKEKEIKTNAMRLLEQKKISYILTMVKSSMTASV